MKAFLHNLLEKRWLFRLIGIGIFILILLKIDLRQSWYVLQTVEPAYLLLSLLIQTIALGVTAYRWMLIMHRLGIQIQYPRSFIYQLIGTAAALVTPGQLGEFIKVLYLRDHGAPVLESVLSVVIDRLFDLMALFLFGFIALAYLFGLPTELILWISLVSGLILISLLLFFKNRQRISGWSTLLLLKASPKVYKQAVQHGADRLAKKVVSLSPGFLFTCSLITLVNYALLILRIYALALAVDIQVSFLYFAMVVPLLRLVGIIPISVSGIGTREISVIYLFSRVGVPQETSLIFSMLGLLTLVFQGLVGLVVWWRFPIHPVQDELAVEAARAP